MGTPDWDALLALQYFGPWITASFDGECDECFTPFEVGEKIRKDERYGWVCESCGIEGDA